MYSNDYRFFIFSTIIGKLYHLMSMLSNLNLKFNKQKRGNNLIFLYKILKILMSKIFFIKQEKYYNRHNHK